MLFPNVAMEKHMRIQSLRSIVEDKKRLRATKMTAAVLFLHHWLYRFKLAYVWRSLIPNKTNGIQLILFN